MKKLKWERITRVVFFLFFMAFTSNLAFAQEANPPAPSQQTPPVPPPPHVPPTVPQQTQPGQQDWQSFKQDMQKKYLQMTTQIDSVKSAAGSKKINDPLLTEAINKFQSAAQDFNQLLESDNKVSPDQYASLKAQLTDKLTDLTAARDHVLDV